MMSLGAKNANERKFEDQHTQLAAVIRMNMIRYLLLVRYVDYYSYLVIIMHNFCRTPCCTKKRYIFSYERVGGAEFRGFLVLSIVKVLAASSGGKHVQYERIPHTTAVVVVARIFLPNTTDFELHHAKIKSREGTMARQKINGIQFTTPNDRLSVCGIMKLCAV